MILQKIQSELKAPKGQTNTFGKYKYRSCEDIVEAVKPILAKYELALTMSDEMVEVGGRVYVKATAVISNKDSTVLVTVSACAREAETKKGMDDAQITGAASSYARKYALNGLFCIDDTKDADATNDHGKEEKKEVKQHTPKTEVASDANKEVYSAHYAAIRDAKTVDDVHKLQVKAEGDKTFNEWPENWQNNIAGIAKEIELKLKESEPFTK